MELGKDTQGMSASNCTFSKTISKMGFLDFFFFVYIINKKTHFLFFFISTTVHHEVTTG